MCKLDSLDLLALEAKTGTEVLRDFLPKDPLGMDGRNCAMFASIRSCDFCSMQEDIASSSSLRENKGFRAEILENWVGFAAKEHGTKHGGTY